MMRFPSDRLSSFPACKTSFANPQKKASMASAIINGITLPKIPVSCSRNTLILEGPCACTDNVTPNVSAKKMNNLRFFFTI